LKKDEERFCLLKNAMCKLFRAPLRGGQELFVDGDELSGQPLNSSPSTNNSS
jgi:hypothetical protein